MNQKQMHMRHKPPAVVQWQAPQCRPLTLRAQAAYVPQQICSQQAAPLLDAVLDRGDRQETPLHVPGHKRGRVLDAGMQQLMMAGGSTPPASTSTQQPGITSSAHSRANALRYDLTELAGLDFLSSPSSVIKAGQDLAAAAFNAQHTWFLVNGCSAGIHAAVMATVRPGKALLLARNCHLSAFSACVLADAVPVWLQPEQDVLHGIAHCITPEELLQGFKAAHQQGLTVGAALVVSPTYYGAVARVAELAQVCHTEGVPLLVDEAHGGHLSPAAADWDLLWAQPAAAQPIASTADAAATSPSSARPAASSQVAAEQAGLASAGATSCASAAAGGSVAAGSCQAGRSGVQPIPASALAQGADLVMHSTHKVLTAMTQAAMLHLNKGSLVSPSRVSKALQVLQTSSPSYILLSSLDAARRHAFTPGVWQEPLAAAQAAQTQLQHVPGLELLQGSNSCSASQSVVGFDPLRLVINVQGLGLNGYDAATWLEQQHGVVPELATNKLVVFVFGPGSRAADAAALVRACEDLSTVHGVHPAVNPTNPATGGPHDTAGCSSSSTSSSSSSSTSSSSSSSTTSSSSVGGLDPSSKHSRSSSSSVSVGASSSSGRIDPSSSSSCSRSAEPPLPALTPRQAFFADTEQVPLQASAGRVSAELLCPYPPGVPVVFPGERFTQHTVQVLLDTLASGGVVTGGHDSTLQSVLVVAADAEACS